MFGQELQVPLGEPISGTLNRAASHGSATNLALDSHGDENTLEYRIKAVDKSSGAKPISLWHDVTLVHVDPATDRPTPYLNFVCEIPKFSRYVTDLFMFFSSITEWVQLFKPFNLYMRTTYTQEKVRDCH